MIVLAASATVALLIVAAAAVIDVVRYEIPDAASLGVLALASIFGLFEPHFGWWSHLAAPLLMFGFGLLAFSRGWLGGGDVKLMTAIAAWTGLAGLPLMFVATSIAGGVLALGFMLARRGIAALAGGHEVGRQPPLPYAVAIAVGTIWWIWATGGGPFAT